MTRLTVVRALFAAASLAALFDGLTTWFALARLTGAEEANPVMFGLIEAVGVGPAMTVRVLIGVAVAAWSARVALRGYSMFSWEPPAPLRLYRCGLDHDRWYAARARASLGLLGISAAVTSTVVAHNARVIASLVAYGG